MSNDPKSIFSRRLKQARKMRGLTLRGLDEQMNGAVTYASLHKYETGQMLPGSAALLAIAGALRQSVDYFFRPPTVELEKIEFRKRSKLKEKQRAEVEERARDFFERYLEVEQLLGMDTGFENPIADLTIRKAEDVETAADRLREAWKLGQTPLPNILELLEDHQVKVYELEAPESFDGLSGWAGKIPVVVVNQMLPADRKRLTALHELAHLLLQFASALPDKEIEKLCHRFAGALLMSREVFLEEFGGKRGQVTWNELCDLKLHYGISLAAIMARAKDLALVTDDYYTRFHIRLNKNHWRQVEPVPFTGLEKSNRFEQLLYRATANEVVSLTKAASLAGKPLAAFRESLQLVS